MEFEDSLTLLRGNRSTTNKRSERPASSTIGPGKRFRAPIMDLIGFYDTPKPTEGIYHYSEKCYVLQKSCISVTVLIVTTVTVCYCHNSRLLVLYLLWRCYNNHIPLP